MTVGSIEELTTDWLGDALGGLPVDDFAATRIGTGQMSDSYRVQLTYAAEMPEAPTSVVLKVAAVDETSRATGAALGLYQREVLFYKEIAPLIGGPIAATYEASFDDADHTFSLLIGDASPARQGDEIAGAGKADATAAIEALAALHRPLLDDARLADSDWLNRESPITSELIKSLLAGLFDRYGEQISPKHQIVCRDLVASFDGWLTLGAAAPKGLVHGDYRLDNLLFEATTGSVTVVDWQTVAHGDAFTDLAYFLGSALTIEDRREFAEDLIATYHAALGPDAPSLEAIDEGIRRQAFFGLMMAIVSPMMVVRTERGDQMFMTALERHAQHVLDLDALAILPEPVVLTPLTPAAQDEQPHPPGPEQLFNESWYFDVVAADQEIGAYVRLGTYANLGRSWYTALICGPDRPTIAVIDFHAPLPAADLSLKTDAFAAGFEFDPALQRARVTLTGTGQTHDDPAALLRGETGDPINVSLDLTWETEGTPYQYRLTTRYEIPCRVRGTLTVGEERFALDAPGQRDHSWGVRDWWSMGWVWFAVHLDDGTRLHGTDLRIPGAPQIGIGYAQAPALPIHELEVVKASETIGADGLATHTRLTLQPGNLGLELHPLGHGPVRLLDDESDRVAHFPRSWCTVKTDDGRSGVAWVEWNSGAP